MKGQGKLNMHIIFESVLMLLEKIIKISPCLRKLQLAKVGAFLRHSVVPEIIFKGHSRSSTMQSFARSPGFSIRHCTAGLLVYFRRKIAEVTSEIDQFSTTRSVVWPLRQPSSLRLCGWEGVGVALTNLLTANWKWECEESCMVGLLLSMTVRIFP